MTHPNLLWLIRSCAKWRNGLLLVATLFPLFGMQITQLPDPPGPVVVGPTGAVIAGDTLVYTIRWGPGARATSYIVTTAVGTTNGSWSVVADSNASGKWPPGFLTNGIGTLTTVATVTYPLLKTWLTAIPWDSATFVVTVASQNAAGTSSPVTAIWSVRRKPGVPGPIIVDSSLIVIGFLVRPDTLNLAVGQTQAICAFPKFWDGAVAIQGGSELACNPLYVPLWKSVSPAQQAIANKLCIQWASSNPAIATVTSAPCPVGTRPEFQRIVSGPTVVTVTP